MKTYTARVECDDGHWLVEVPELRIHTFGRSVADAEAMARDAIAGVLDVPIEEVAVDLEVDDAAAELTEVARARTAREQAAAREVEATRAAIRALLDQGAAQRDTARLLGISHQRVSQIAATLRSARPQPQRTAGDLHPTKRPTAGACARRETDAPGRR